MKKASWISLLTAIIMLAQVCFPVLSFSEKAEQFVIAIEPSDESCVNLAGIVIDVYSAAVGSGLSQEYIEYNEEYAFSAETNGSGTVCIDRPSTCFSFTVREETLPDHYGIEEKTKFIQPGTSDYSILLYPVCDAVFEEKNGREQLTFVNAEGKKLITNSGLTIEDQEDRTDHSFQDSEPYQSDDCPVICCVKEKSERLNRDEPEYEDFYTTPNYFHIQYNPDLVTEDEAEAIGTAFLAVDAQFCNSWGFTRPFTPGTNSYSVTIDELPMHTWGETIWAGPQAVMQTSINIAPEIAASIAQCYAQNQTSCAAEGVLAHEYMHAIMHMYGIHYSSYPNNPLMWMHECFADWAGTAYRNDFYNLFYQYSGGSATNALHIKDYLSTTNCKLTDTTLASPPLGYCGCRHYGSSLFPLYIDRALGGYQTIEMILYSFQYSNTNPLSAIDAGLNHEGYDFDDAYAEFAAEISDVDYFYNGGGQNCILVDSNKKHYLDISYINEFKNYNAYPITVSTRTNEPVSSEYYLFKAFDNSNATLTITVDKDTSYLGTLHLSTIVKDGNNDCTVNNHSITSRTTVVLNNFGTDISQVVLMTANSSKTAQTGYSFSASIDFLPCSDGQYVLKCSSGGRYLTVYGGIDSNGTNVIQESSLSGDKNKFRLELVSSGVYRIRAMCSSNGTNRVLDIKKQNGSVVSGCNVQIYTAVDPIAQKWRFVSVGSGYYKIVADTNQNLSLTTYGSTNGTSSGTTSTSAGNVFISTYSGSSHQKWKLIPMHDTAS